MTKNQNLPEEGSHSDDQGHESDSVKSLAQTKMKIETETEGRRSWSQPLLILMIGALFVFALTRLFSNDQDYKRLVSELESRRFGNKWVSAYELSKWLASSQIPVEERPWLSQKLSELYRSGTDPKTRNFLITALGSLQDPNGLEALTMALSDPDEKCRFSALTALGNFPKDIALPKTQILDLLDSQDQGLQHGAILTVGSRGWEEGRKSLIGFLKHESPALRFASATALITYKEDLAVETIKQILRLSAPGIEQFNDKQKQLLRINIIQAFRVKEWMPVPEELQRIVDNDPDKSLVVLAKETLNLLKN